MVRSRVFVLLAVAGSIVAAPGLLIAQPTAAPTADPAPTATPAATPAAPVTPIAAPSAPMAIGEARTKLLALALERLAVLDLRAIKSPQPRDYAAAVVMLDFARTFTPDAVELVRRQADAAWNAGDEAMLLSATRRVVELDPNDTVAQLRLITARIGQQQTANDRAAVYDRFVQSDKIDPSIRSRLAVDAALLARERGDEVAFVGYLKQATALDSTNKDAALLAFTYFDGKGNHTPRERVQMLCNLLLAEPLDAKVHLQLAEELARVGAWDQAARFHNTGKRLLTAFGDSDPNVVLRDLIIRWRLRGGQEALSFLNRELLVLRGPQTPDARLSIDAERVRLAAAYSLRDSNATASSIRELGASITESITQLSDATKRPAELTEADAAAITEELTLELAFWRQVTGLDISAQPINAATAANEPIRNAIEALATVTTNPEQAQALVAAASDDARVILARAIIAEKVGKPAEALAIYNELQSASPLSEFGAIAVEAIKRLGPVVGAAPVNPETPPSNTIIDEDGEIIHVGPQFNETEPPMADEHTDGSEIASGEVSNLDPNSAAGIAFLVRSVIPAGVDSMVTSPRLFQLVRTQFAKVEANPGERVPVLVRMRNLTTIPLGMGPDRSISTRFLFSPSFETSVSTPLRPLQAEVFDLDRRMRLMPGEEVTYTIYPDVGLAGWLADVECAYPSRARWRAIQGFDSSDSGPRKPGPACVEDTTQTLLRQPLPEARITVDTLLERLPKATGDELWNLIIASRMQILNSTRRGIFDPVARTIADALKPLYGTWDAPTRLFALATLPPAGEVQTMIGFDEAARAERDPLVVRAAILTRITSANDPLLDAAIASNDPALAHLATIHRERLTQGVETYAQRGTVPVE